MGGFVLPFLGWGLLTGDGDPTELVAFGLVAAVAMLPVFLLLVPPLALGAHALLRRAGAVGAPVHAGAGAGLGALAGFGTAVAAQWLGMASNVAIGVPLGASAGMAAALAFWAVRRPDRAVQQGGARG
jgi:hypothetical protein